MKLFTLVLIGLFQTLFLQPLRGQGSINKEHIEREILWVMRIVDHDEVLDSLVTMAYNSSGLLQAFNQEIGIYEEEILQKKRNWISSLRFGLSIFSANTVVQESQSVTTLGVLPNLGLNLSIDPEQFINRSSYLRQAVHKQERAQYQMQEHRQQLKLELLRQYYDYLTLLESVLLKVKTLQTRQQHLDVIEIAFKNGNATYDEVMVVQNQLNLWEEDLMKTRMAILKKKKELLTLTSIQ